MLIKLLVSQIKKSDNICCVELWLGNRYWKMLEQEVNQSNLVGGQFKKALHFLLLGIYYNTCICAEWHICKDIHCSDAYCSERTNSPNSIYRRLAQKSHRKYCAAIKIEEALYGLTCNKNQDIFFKKWGSEH